MHIRIVRTPEGTAPEYVREAWVGLVFPVYKGRLGKRYILDLSQTSGRLERILLVLRALLGLLPEKSLVYVVRSDIAFDMLSKSSPLAAQWWRENPSQFLTSPSEIGFRFADCEELEDIDQTCDLAFLNSELNSPRSVEPFSAGFNDQTPSDYMSFESLFRGIAVGRRFLIGAFLGGILGIAEAIHVLVWEPGNPMIENLRNPQSFALFVLGFILVGVAVSGAIALKVVKQLRYSASGPQMPFLVALFGFGRWSLLLFWLPLILGIIILVFSAFGP